MKFVGMRTLKTALAVTLSVYLALLLNLESPFFVAIAAIITMQGNLVDSFSMAKYRILGTFLGAIMGFVGAYFAHGNPLVLGLGIALIIYAMNMLKWNKAIVIAAIVFASIMLNVQEVASIIFSLNRVLDTFVGIAVAFVVNFAISRPYSRDRVIKSATDLVNKCKAIIKMLVFHDGNLSLAAITDELDILETELPTLKKEVKMHLVRTKQDLDFDAIKVLIEKLYVNIEVLMSMAYCSRLNPENVRILNQVYGLELSPETELQDKDIVYNYHLTIVLELMEALAKIFDLSIHEQAGMGQ